MNFELPYLPERTQKPRQRGLTMMMDKGLSNTQTEYVIDSCGHLIDLVKFGFGTSYLTKNLKVKLALYREANIKCYLGGTLFEVFVARGLFDEYRKLLDDLKLDVAEVSDGCIHLPQDEKLKFIEKLSEQVTVLSEVGSKSSDVVLSDEEWINKMTTELQAGSWKVIAEARESGTIGIYDSSGSAKKEMIDHISNEVGTDNIIWEAPIKGQQVYFINKFGANVNLGNIASSEVIPLETLRLGLRGDTFFNCLPDEIIKKFS
ncbi:MAG: phosphosulfolactate synthase [Crocinitomicaceae bacterium]|nr:phosphosulfolactate synthase [Crocinitomicaceae bacterium]|tara:strand:- start:8127 stop:8909 length:783 start_codon:yes stop_codon:yes gene_type:complete